jgi:hypothetical protein
MDHIVREVIEIELRPNNMNREVGFVSASHGNLSSASSRNPLNMTRDLQGYKATKVNARSPFLAPKLLGQFSLRSSGFSSTPTDPLPLIDLLLLPAGDLQHRPYHSPLC